jgi:ribonuclease HI
MAFPFLDVGNDLPLYEYEEEIERVFDPTQSLLYRSLPESQLIIYNTEKQVSQLQILHPRTMKVELERLTLVVWIDGACRNNGKPSAKASWGAYFGPHSRYNDCSRLASNMPQTSSRAEIEALSKALDIIQEITAEDMSLQQILIVSDSEYLVRSMSEWITRWIENGGRGSNGQPVAHFATLKGIHERLDEMTYGDDGGLNFKFWHVPRAKNTEADALANQALDE